VGDAVRDGVGDGGRVVVGAGEPDTAPVQALPLRVKLVGAGLVELFHEPLRPKDVLALVPRVPL
jgi:hypothetical protein